MLLAQATSVNEKMFITLSHKYFAINCFYIVTGELACAHAKQASEYNTSAYQFE